MPWLAKHSTGALNEDMTRERKNEMLSIRVSPTTLDSVRRKAKQHGMSAAEFVAQLIEGAPEFPAATGQRRQGKQASST